MVTVKDLDDQIIHKDRANEFLHCYNCQTRFSANSGDYFMLPKTHVFKCSECGKPMVLATSANHITIVKE